METNLKMFGRSFLPLNRIIILLVYWIEGRKLIEIYLAFGSYTMCNVLRCEWNTAWYDQMHPILDLSRLEVYNLWNTTHEFHS